MKRPALALLLALSPAAARAADYGAFLDAQYAVSVGQMGRAADSIVVALNADPSNPSLRRDAFGLALLADRPEAAHLAASLPENPVALLLAADTQARAGNWQGAELAYAELPHEALLDALRPVLLAWSQQAQGRTDKALDTLQSVMSGDHLTEFYLLHAALIADHAHRDGLASRLYGQLAKTLTQPNLRLSQILASWQARSGQLSDARATIDSLVGAAPELTIAHDSLLKGDARPQVATPAQGIAEAYLGMAAALRHDQKSEMPALILHLALLMQPGLAEARLIAADMADEQHHPQDAASQLAAVPASSSLYSFIALRLADEEARAGQTDQALALLTRLAADNPDRYEPLLQKGDVLADSKHFKQAVDAYSAAIARVPHPTRADWVMFYARGASLQRAGEWNAAEADMEHALTLYPDQPVVLNFLGFSWADQDRNLPQAHAMIQRALDQRPNDGEIVDSLGWVMLRQGDARGAVHMLEKAAELLPVDPTVTGHLGDAYWQLGRKLEAEDQWRRALVLGPDADDAARIKGRLKDAGAE